MRRFIASPVGQGVQVLAMVVVLVAVLWGIDASPAPDWMYWLVFGLLAAAVVLSIALRPRAWWRWIRSWR